MMKPRIAAEVVLGRPLKRGQRILKWNGWLIVCPDEAYHWLMLIRLKSFAATGDYNNRLCRYCRKWDSPANLLNVDKTTANGTWQHKGCRGTKSPPPRRLTQSTFR